MMAIRTAGKIMCGSYDVAARIVSICMKIPFYLSVFISRGSSMEHSEDTRRTPGTTPAPEGRGSASLLQQSLSIAAERREGIMAGGTHRRQERVDPVISLNPDATKSIGTIPSLKYAITKGQLANQGDCDVWMRWPNAAVSVKIEQVGSSPGVCEWSSRPKIFLPRRPRVVSQTLNFVYPMIYISRLL